MTGGLLGDRPPTVPPVGVVSLDEGYYPISPPFLDFFLARDRFDHIIIDFEPDQPADPIFEVTPPSALLLC